MAKINLIKKISVRFLKAPLIQPFRTALGQHETLENLIFTLELNDGTKGYGEAAVAQHITGETLQGTERNLKVVGESLIGQDVSDYLSICAPLHERLSGNKCALAAIETALFDALTRQIGIPLWKMFGPKPQRLVSDITIVIADLKETEEAVKKYYKQGFRRFKVKIGKDEDLDLKRVIAVKRLGRGGKIILDANQAFSAEQTIKFVKRLEKSGVHPILLEQPVPKDDWDGLKKITRSLRIPVCADESVRSLKEALQAVRQKAVKAINVKITKTGIIESREIALLAKANGLKLMISGMMESKLAMTASAHLAAGLGFFDYIDLDTTFFIKNGNKNNPYLNSRGVYDLSKVKAGIGITPL